jgi:hypothetical protein
MSYRVLETEQGYDIVEKETNVVIELKRDEKEAKDLCRKLNLGAGFCGWTPMFLAEKMGPL